MVAVANPGRNPPEIDVLRWEHEPDRFRHVYRDDAGGDRPNRPWLAKIKVGGIGVVRLGRHPTPRAAAAACLRWYADTFGDDWRAWVGRLHPQCPLHGDAWQILFDGPGRWRLMVWELGERRRVAGPRGGYFPTRALAWAAYRRLRAGYGVLAPAALSRTPPLVCGTGGEWRPAVRNPKLERRR